MIQIRTDDKDVLESKIFLAVGSGETSITLGEGTERLHFILEFITDDSKDHEVNFIGIDDKSLRIQFHNWNSTLGVTFPEPAEVGTFKNRKLYLMFYIKKAGSKGEIREILFTAYLGGEVQDGSN